MTNTTQRGLNMGPRLRRTAALCGMLGVILSGVGATSTDRPAAVASAGALSHPVAAIPFDAPLDFVLLRVRAGKADAGWYVLDTGAGTTVLDTATAKACGIAPNSRVSATVKGTGEAKVRADVYPDVPLSVGGQVVQAPMVVSISLEAISERLGRRISGILGSEIFRRYVVEIDYPARILRLYEPAGYRYAGGGLSLPLTFVGNRPHTSGRVVPLSGRPFPDTFHVDTGFHGGVDIPTPLVREHSLLETLPVSVGIRSYGVGGATETFIGRLRRVELGPLALESPVSRFSQATGGLMGTERIVLLGNDVLHRYRVILDYRRSRMFLEPTPATSAPYEASMTGLQLLASGSDYRTYTVDAVMSGTPADEVGLRAGDVLLQVDGRPAASYTMADFDAMAAHPDRTIAFTVRRGGGAVQASLTTRRLL